MRKRRKIKKIVKSLEASRKYVLIKIEKTSIYFGKLSKNIVNQLISQAEVVADIFYTLKQVNVQLDDRRNPLNEKLKNLKILAKKSIRFK